MLLEFLAKRCDQLAILLVDRALPAKVVVVLGHREHPFPWDIPSTKNIFEEGNHLLIGLGPTKRHE